MKCQRITRLIPRKTNWESARVVKSKIDPYQFGGGGLRASATRSSLFLTPPGDGEIPTLKFRLQFYGATEVTFREMLPGLLQHVLSWFSGPGCCSCPSFHLGLGASDCSPGLAFCFTGPWTLLGSAARNSPTTRAKTRDTQHMFLQHRGHTTRHFQNN